MKKFSFIILLGVLFTACSEKDAAEIGDAHFKKGEYKKAVAAYTEFLSMKPANEIAIYNRGRAYEELGEYDKALADFKKVLEMNPKSEQALLSIGKNYYRQEDYANAAFQFEKAFEANSQNAQAALLLARANHKAGEVEKAMEFYNKAVSLKNNYGEAYMYRGALNIFLNKMTSGCSDLKRAKNLGYEPAEALYKEYCN